MATINKRLSMLLCSATFAAGAALLASTPVQAGVGTVILEGSDSVGYHCSQGNAGACLYMNQTWSALGGSDPRKIAIVGDTTFGSANILANSTTHGVAYFTSLAGASANLFDYAAIYFTGNNGCCSSDPASVSGRTGELSAYVAGGGTVQIGDYDGNSGWDFLVGGSGNTAGAFSAGCSDAETVSATGLANGFTQPPAFGCWTHQYYSTAWFGALGFTKSFFDFPGGAPGTYSGLLSRGSTITGGGGFGGGVPEPATWAMMLLGFGGIGATLRASRRRTVAATA
jgi:hypothetical protein